MLPPEDPPTPSPSPSSHLTVALVFGYAGLLGWLLPLLGVPLTIIGVVLSARGLRSPERRRAVLALVLNIVGLVLSIGSSALGFYWSMHPPY
jgi:hypothetical protein